jgi:hypothetical protein
MLNGWLLAMSDDDLGRAIDAVYDSKVAGNLETTRPELLCLIYDQNLRKQAEHFAMCDFDRTLAILRWNDSHD